MRRNQRKEEQAWREQQRLRVGGARMAAEMVGVPERNLTALQRVRQKPEHRIKVVLGVPRDDGIAEIPERLCQQRKRCQAEYGSKRLPAAPAQHAKPVAGRSAASG